MTESIILILITIHALLGGIALLSGLTSLVAVKGRKVHIISGKIFYNSMIFSALLALVISASPKHESPFLFCIGLFSLYFIFAGRRAIKFKDLTTNHLVDKILAIGMLTTCIAMIFMAMLEPKSINIVLLVFGLFGGMLAIADFRALANIQKLQREYLPRHLRNMIGGYIAASTAFIVVNQIIPGISGWLTPGLIGTFFIIYHIRKINKSRVN